MCERKNKNNIFFQNHFENKVLQNMVGLVSYFLLQQKGHSSKLRNKNKLLVLIWKKNPESFALKHYDF